MADESCLSPSILMLSEESMLSFLKPRELFTSLTSAEVHLLPNPIQTQMF